MKSISISYKIELFSYWHAGSGLSGAANMDLAVHKDRDGLPFIPGRTLKGLLREAAETILAFDTGSTTGITEEFITSVFGEQRRKIENKNNDTTNNEDVDPDELETFEDHYRLSGDSFFNNAYLSHELITNMVEGDIDHLYHTIASTAIKDNGIALDKSLRQMEVTIPITLYATIEDFPQKYEEQLEWTMKWIKRMGQNRNRGLGRCEFSIIK